MNIFIEVPWNRTRVLTYYKEHNKGSTRCKTENSNAKPKCRLHCILKVNEFTEKSICIILFKTWFTCLGKEIFLFIIWIIILLFYLFYLFLLIMIIFYIPKLWKKLISVSFGGLVLSAKSSSLKTVPVSCPWVAGKFQETGPLWKVSVSHNIVMSINEVNLLPYF